MSRNNPTFKDVSEASSRLQKMGHGDLIPAFLGQNATITKTGRLSSKKGVNEGFDISRTAYKKGFSIEDFINQMIGTVKSAMGTTSDITEAIMVERVKRKEPKPKFTPSMEGPQASARLNSRLKKNLAFIGEDEEAKGQIAKALRDAGVKVTDDPKSWRIPKNLTKEQYEQIDRSISKPKQFSEQYVYDMLDELKRDDFYSYIGNAPTLLRGQVAKFEKSMKDIGRKLRHQGPQAAADKMQSLVFSRRQGSVDDRGLYKGTGGDLDEYEHF